MTKYTIPTLLVTLMLSAWSLAIAQETILPSSDAPVTQSVITDVAATDEVVIDQTVLFGPVMEPMMEVNSTDEADYFVLSIPPIAEEQEAKVDVIILCDTSATMNGNFREDEFAALSLVTDSLGVADRVQIMACDLNAVSMTQGFVAPGSVELTAAVEKLQRRAPLGSMDIEKALRSAMENFDAASDAARVVVFIGQGSSRANILLPKEFSDLADELVAQKISVDSVAVGPNVDVVVLKTLAAKTGGMVVATADPNFGDLPNMIRRKVGWTAGEAQHSFNALYPVQIPPMRSDRETIVVGKANKGVANSSLKFSLADGTPVSANFQPKNAVGTYVSDMVKKVESTNGWLPLERWADVMNVMKNVDSHVDSMIALADELLNGPTFELEKAAELVKQAENRAPNNAKVQEMAKLVKDLQAMNAGDASQFANLDVGGLEAEVKAEDVETQRARFMVQETINKARQIMSSNPTEAIEILTVELTRVDAIGLSPEDQDTLKKQLQSSIREAKSREEAQSIKKAEDRTRLMEMRERQIALDNAKTEQQNMQQMMRRFDSLMDEGKYRDAEEDAAAAVLEKDPDNIAAIAGTMTARHRGYMERNRQIVIQRQKNFVDALYQAEIGNIPFPDDPPVVYPDSEVWKRLTEKRVEKYSSMDLAQRSQVEKKLMEALKETTQVSEVETPLPEVIDKLKEQHNIEIQLDTIALEEDSIDVELPITLDVHGISLGAALKLMLTSNGMMYVIEDEVLKITTQMRAEESLSTRVYPVADLVIPIQNLPPQNGGMGGGMLGGSG
ncbi:MAG: VWA domain-containing protein, partial [Planctomycetia bacterium]|nr:VWA domain-containing protein [Planctomycetia bacterium]